MVQLQNYIGGEFMPSQNGECLSGMNPATNQVIHQVPDSDSGEVDAAVYAAQHAALTWQSELPEIRIKILLKIADELQKRSAIFAQAESQNQGKPLAVVQALDIPMAINAFREAASGLAHEHEKSFSRVSHQLQYSLREPLGICALIVPWNFPLMLLAQKIAPALAAGNCVICKPSELTSLTAYLLAKMFADLQIPPGIINIVFGRGSRVGAALVRHPNIQGVSFTGSTETGQALAAEAIRTMKTMDLEMGGKNPCLIFADCDQAATVSSVIRSGFLNSGQVCLATSRLFVERKIFAEFTEKFVAKMRRLGIGDPMIRTTFIGPLISENHRRKVLNYIEQARGIGAEILSGQEIPAAGEFSHGYFVTPSIIMGGSPDSAIMQDEIFGPVVTLSAFDDFDEVINLANNTRYGLAAGVWTTKLSTAHQAAAKLIAGTIWVNSWMTPNSQVGIKGYKNSGYGSSGSEFYSRLKAIKLQI